MTTLSHKHTSMLRHPARLAFPGGLRQPPGSFRFSLDALLLASFARPDESDTILDLGTGCGVVALAMLCLRPGLLAVGVDDQHELVTAARHNAGLLGFAERFTAVQADISVKTAMEQALFQAAPPASFSLVVANPPYKKRGQGRLPRHPLRLGALFERPDTLPAFCAAAASTLAPGGNFCMVYPYAREEELLTVLAGQGFAPVRRMAVKARNEAAPSLLLLETKKNMLDTGTAQDCAQEDPLILHEEAGSRFTRQALAFCPFLAGGSGRIAPEQTSGAMP